MLGGKLKSINTFWYAWYKCISTVHVNVDVDVDVNVERSVARHVFLGQLMHPSDVQHNLLNLMIQFYALATGLFFLLFASYRKFMCMPCHMTRHSSACSSSTLMSILHIRNASHPFEIKYTNLQWFHRKWYIWLSQNFWIEYRAHWSSS